MNTETKTENKTPASAPAQIPTTMLGFLGYVFKLIMQKKKYWLLPFWAFLLALAAALFLTGNGALLPAIYMAF